MYSEVVFGWPETSISPSRVMSRPTEIMFVASATSTRWSSVKSRASRRLASATSAVPTREVSSTGSNAICRSANRPVASSRRRRSEQDSNRAPISSSTIRRALPSSRRALK